jgi:hypothetical protein
MHPANRKCRKMFHLCGQNRKLNGIGLKARATLCRRRVFIIFGGPRRQPSRLTKRRG